MLRTRLERVGRRSVAVNFLSKSISGHRSSYIRRMSTVMSFGDASQGALGVSTSEMVVGVDAYEPTPVQALPSDITKISAGHYHSLAVDSRGAVWSWGRNQEGQLGRHPLSPKDARNDPQKVKGLEQVNVCAVSASGVISAAIGDDGSLWVWGKSKRGQLGIGKNNAEALVPHKIGLLSGEKITKVSFGWGHSLALTEDGKLFGWGYSADGRIGKVGEPLHVSPLDSHANTVVDSQQSTSLDLDFAEKLVAESMEKEKDMPIIWEPRLVEELQGLRVKDIACGLDHSLVLCCDGTLLSCGSNVYGQLGRVKTGSGMEPILLSSSPISIASGLGHSFAICEGISHDIDGSGASIFSWGWNQNYQLGRTGPGNVPMLIVGLEGETAISVAGGRVHSIALTANGQLWVWGCGKNGRLGLGSSIDEAEPVLLDSLEGFDVLQAACGFDHNLILVAD